MSRSSHHSSPQICLFFNGALLLLEELLSNYIIVSGCNIVKSNYNNTVVDSVVLKVFHHNAASKA